jgi:2,3-bisphosphoglycerate-dependent phosphoglycerate mutase
MAYTKLVLIRHGESECNRIKKWSGWSDAQLTPKGEADAAECARLLAREGLKFDLAYCSYLSRTIKTLNIILDTLDCLYLPVRKRWQLN